MNIISKLGREDAVDIVSRLSAREILIFPTETSYGLGCDATSQAAVDKIFKIKGRVGDKPLLVVVPDVAMAKKYLVWNELLEDLASKYWPGAVTIVGEYQKSIPPYRRVARTGHKNQNLANGVVAQDGTVAIRVTANSFLKSITEKLGRPIVATSANLAGAGEIYDSAEAIKVFENLENKPDAIVAGGILPNNPPSTIVSVVGGKFQVLRQGNIKVC